MSNLELLQLIPPVLVVVFLIYFVWRFWTEYRVPGRRMRVNLDGLTSKIVGLKELPASRRRDALAEVFAGSDERLQHAWGEFKETLHSQYEDADGERRIACTRSTVPAAYFFASQNIVDTPLKTEYFKHLPGILTGIGIIGTFAGLLLGLTYFDASDPEKVQQSVSLLLNGVRDAFVASALAIACAMYITNSEKKYLRACYASLEMLTDNIDKLFESGVGEEYLASLVKSSEESARQARQLKDGLVTDLREMLQNLVDSQVRENLKLAETLGSVYRESGDSIAASISGSIESSFRDPLNKIADSVQSVSGDQSGQVQNLLQDVLTAFMARLDATFGQQLGGMQEMMVQSVTAMQQMQGAFQSLISDMRLTSESSSQAVHEQLGRTLAEMQAGQSAMQASMSEMLASLQQAVDGIGNKGEEAGSRMAEQLERMFTESEMRQQKMSESMQAFVDGLKESVGKGQQETMAEISATVGKLGEQLSNVMQTLETSRQGMDTAAVEAQLRMQDGAREVVDGLGTQVQGLLEALHEQQTDSRQSLKQLGEVTSRSIEGMKEGADRMRSAADRFDAAGQSAAKLAEASGASVQQINASAGSVSTAARELASQIADYRSHREAMQKVLASIEGVAAAGQNEAAARTRMIADLQHVVQQMQEVNGEAAIYLERVNAVLDNSFTAFGDGVKYSLDKTLGSLDQQLDSAVRSLSAGVQDLGEGVEELADVMGKAAMAGRRS